MNLDQIASQFYTAGITYSTAIQPYALKLFFALFLIDITVTWIQYSAEGQLDPSYFLGRMIKHILSGGFIYLMIVNAFSWMNAVVRSFSMDRSQHLRTSESQPARRSPSGGQIANMIFSAPASTSVMGNLEIAIVQSVSGFAVLFAFTLTAAMLLFTLVEAYIAIGGGTLLLGFGGNRYTASAAEGYFPFVIRVGVRLLFYYLVLAVGMQLVNQWNAALEAACKPVSAAVPLIYSYYVPPSKIMTTVCSGGLSTHDMLDYTIGCLGLCVHDRRHSANSFQLGRRFHRTSTSARFRGSLHRPDHCPSHHQRPQQKSTTPSQQKGSSSTRRRRCAGRHAGHTELSTSGKAAPMRAQMPRPRCSTHSTVSRPATTTVRPGFTVPKAHSFRPRRITARRRRRGARIPARQPGQLHTRHRRRCHRAPERQGQGTD